MNFQKLAVIEKYQTYLDMAFRNASKQATKLRNTLKTKKKASKIKALEKERIKIAAKSLINNLNAIIESYPRFDELPEFYKKLAKITLDIDILKKSLGAVNWAKKRIKELSNEYETKIKRNKVLTKFTQIRQEFYGRASSVIKQIKQDLQKLENARKTMKRWPALKTAMYTVAIAGAPNVGKSSLLAKLTGTKPKIAQYPFTTQNLNLGYDKKNQIQYIDTPGLLDRPLVKRNKIEQQAIIALDKVAKLILFVLDPSETCGYSIKEQTNILKDIKKRFTTPIITIANKTDLACKEHKADMQMSLKEKKGIEKLKKKILARKTISSKNNLK